VSTKTRPSGDFFAHQGFRNTPVMTMNWTEVSMMHETGEYGASQLSLSEDRRIYLRYLRQIHDDEHFLLARHDQLSAPCDDVDRLVFEVEMLANYGVA
jgi:hypothetical protein